MGVADFHTMSAMALAEAVAGGTISSRDLLDLFAARIEAHNGALNAVVALDMDRARAAAADEATAKGERWGPLHGLPITIKDAFETEGLVTTCGDPALKNYSPARDAEPVARLKSAGAIVIGKTNVPYLVGDLQTFNAIHGTTNNPWDVALTPGGSSGGAAAAVAAGMSAFELGSDIGGSIRIPSHFCGLFGHKPTFGLVSQRGHIPPAPGALAQPDLCVAGPIARSAGDLAPLLSIMAGEPDGSQARRSDLPPPRRERPEGLRIALWLDNPLGDVDAEVAGAVEAAARALEREGARIDERARPGFSFADAYETYAVMMFAIITTDFPARIHDALVANAANAKPGDTSHDALMARGAALTHAQWLALNQTRARLMAKWAEFFEDVDVVLCPPVQIAAFPHDHRPVSERTLKVNGAKRPYLDVLHWAGLATGCHLPATVAPAGQTSAGLPLGVQIIGPHGEDLTAIAVARMLEALHMAFEPPPGFA